MTYRFVQGIDYGPRSGTRGIGFHMSEGGDGLVNFLRRHSGEDIVEWGTRVSGVSCHGAILTTGELVQMLDWDHACGNLNPDDRAKEYGYYGHHHLVDVLGDGWTNPNEWSVSFEIAGYRSSATAPSTWKLPPGPTPAQVATAIKVGKEMKARFPTIRGAFGHHDQSPKGCPGTTANMKAIFTGLGGHGLWTGEDDSMKVGDAINGGWESYTIDAGKPDERTVYCIGGPRNDDGSTGPHRWCSPGLGSNLLTLVDRTRLTDGKKLPDSPGLFDAIATGALPTSDCADAIAADRARARIVYE